MSRLLFFTLLTFLYSCSDSTQKIIFTPITSINVIDTTVIAGKKLISKQVFYLMDNYTSDSNSQNSIDSFVNENKEKTLTSYNNYSITFYKRSDQTNIENIIKNKRIVDRYSNQNDLIYGYSWYNGKFLARYKYKDGVIIEPKNDIIVKDVPE